MSFEISSVGDFESFDCLCRGYFKEFLLPPMHPVPGSKSALGDSRGNLPHPHSVKSFKQVERVELVLLILQSNQKWGNYKI